MNSEFEAEKPTQNFVVSGNLGQEYGVQPLDQLMEEFGLSNHDLVEAYPKQMSHKNVKNARSGRRLSTPMQYKILEALHAALSNKEIDAKFTLKDLFNYKG